MKVGLTGSALRADRHADSACEGSIFLGAKSFRPTASGGPSSGTLESCAHLKSGVCALPTCAENAAAVIAKKAGAISSHTRICASSRDWCRYRYLLGRCRGRQITHQYWHFLTASSRSPRWSTLLLRAYRDRPRWRRAAKQRDELAPVPHSIISSARASAG